MEIFLVGVLFISGSSGIKEELGCSGKEEKKQNRNTENQGEDLIEVRELKCLYVRGGRGGEGGNTMMKREEKENEINQAASYCPGIYPKSPK